MACDKSITAVDCSSSLSLESSTHPFIRSAASPVPVIEARRAIPSSSSWPSLSFTVEARPRSSATSPSSLSAMVPSSPPPASTLPILRSPPATVSRAETRRPRGRVIDRAMRTEIANTKRRDAPSEMGRDREPLRAALSPCAASSTERCRVRLRICVSLVSRTVNENWASWNRSRAFLSFRARASAAVSASSEKDWTASARSLRAADSSASAGRAMSAVTAVATSEAAAL